MQYQKFFEGKIRKSDALQLLLKFTNTTLYEDYFGIKADRYNSLDFVANDIKKLATWFVPSIKGQYRTEPVVACSHIQKNFRYNCNVLYNDFFSWRDNSFFYFMNQHDFHAASIYYDIDDCEKQEQFPYTSNYDVSTTGSIRL